MIRWRVPYLLLLLGSMVSWALLAAEGYSVHVAVTGAEPREGQILATLFDSSESYMRTPLAQVDVAVDAEGVAFVDFGKHAPGEYAVVAIYDQNGNGELDTGLLGVPKEKIGFSNNAKALFGPAKWDATRFLLHESDLQIDIQLNGTKAGN